MMSKYFSFILMMIGVTLWSQEHFPHNGPSDHLPDFYTITEVSIVVSPDETIENGSLAVKNGKIFFVKSGKSIADGSVEIQMPNRIIFPSFIESYAEIKIGELAFKKNSPGMEQLETQRKGYYWNDHIRPEVQTYDYASHAQSKFKSYIEKGFGVVNFHQDDGISRGTSAILSLTNKDEHLILKKIGTQQFSLKRGSSSQKYPTSLMGQYALLRQFFADAKWYESNTHNEKDLSLSTYNENKNIPHIIDLDHSFNYFTTKDLDQPFIYLTTNEAFEQLDVINTKDRFILPLNFPKAFKFEDSFDERLVSLHQLKLWKQAPFQPALFEKKNILFAFTSHDTEKTNDFFDNLRKAVEYGLSEKQALAALTTEPAEFLGIKDKTGTLEKDKQANFIIFNENPFKKKAVLLENWVAGERNILKSYPNLKPGKYVLKYDTEELAIDLNLVNAHLVAKADSTKLTINENANWLTINIKNKLNLSGILHKSGASGTFIKEGKNLNWELNYLGKPTGEKDKKDTAKKKEEMQPLSYPNVAFGFHEKPKPETILIQNATVWTMESDGILENYDVLIKNGKIVKIGKNLSASGAKIINGTGKHLTPGMIDEHSHAGIRGGVNEAGWNITSEVRIGDALNPNDANLFRQMARGVTTSQLLHGSANPIGGQSQLIKLRWGESAQGLKFEGAPAFIKFALGENVKQSNWSPLNAKRYPQSRLGVEQTFVDAFNRAKNYDASNRKNYRLKALSEILNKERFITCHSYVQSEILMLMEVAKSFDFQVNTFTHILEGYKVAPEMKAHGVAASTFSDWWAYKFEVNDAIPYNAAILTRVGVNTAINSDDREMAQRLNQEAAKMVKYGDVSEQEAMAMITINPAKMLRVDDRVGSIKVDKDADLVLWSAHPLSVSALSDYTIIDGKIYFDRNKYPEQLEKIQTERTQLIHEMKNHSGEKKEVEEKKEAEAYHCDTI